MQITSVRQTEAAGVETASRNRSVPLTGTGPSGVRGHRQVQPPHGHVMAMASHRAAPPHNTTHPGSRPVARNDRRPAATPAVHQLPDRTLRRPCRPTEAHALRVVHDAFGWGLCCSVAPGSVSVGPTHTPPPPLWILVLRLGPRASSAGNMVPHRLPERPPELGYISRRVRHDHRLPNTSEDVNIVSVYCFAWVWTRCSATLTDAYTTIAMIRNLSEDVNTESVDCLAWVQTVWFNCKGLVWVPGMGRERGLRLRVRFLRCLPKRLTAATHRRAEFHRPSPSVPVRGLRCGGAYGRTRGGVGWGEREG
jgi:hypothetical protein